MTGREDATLSFLHAADAARAFADAIEGSASGTFHVVDDEPATFAAFLEGFADRLNASSPSRVPAAMAKLLIDENVLRLITRSMPTSNEKFSNAFDWQPAYPTIEEGLDQVFEEWQETGVLRETDDGFEWAGSR